MNMKIPYAQLDIETLGTETGSAIYQIGLQIFEFGTWKTLVAVSLEVDVTAELLAGASVDPETIQWHRERGYNRHESSVVYSPAMAMDMIRELLDNLGVQYIFANSPSFDCIQMEAFAKRHGEEGAVGSFRNWLDLRTLKWVYAIESGSHWQSTASKDPHEAIADCYAQTLDVQGISEALFTGLSEIERST